MRPESPAVQIIVLLGQPREDASARQRMCWFYVTHTYSDSLLQAPCERNSLALRTGVKTHPEVTKPCTCTRQSWI